jgi:transposase-like protein
MNWVLFILVFLSAQNVLSGPPSCGLNNCKDNNLTSIGEVAKSITPSAKKSDTFNAPIDCEESVPKNLQGDGAFTFEYSTPFRNLNKFDSTGRLENTLVDRVISCLPLGQNSDEIKIRESLVSDLKSQSKRGPFFRLIEEYYDPSLKCYAGKFRADNTCTVVKAISLVTARDDLNQMLGIEAERDRIVAEQKSQSPGAKPKKPEPLPTFEVDKDKRDKAQAEVKRKTDIAGASEAPKTFNRNTEPIPKPKTEIAPEDRPIFGPIVTEPTSTTTTTLPTQEPEVVAVNEDRVRDNSRTPASVGGIASGGSSAESSGSTSVVRTRSSTTRSSSPPKPSTTAQANNYVSQAARTNSPDLYRQVDNATSVYRSTALAEKNQGNLNSSFQSYLRGGDPQGALNVLRSAAITNSSRATPVTRTTPSSQLPQPNYNLSQGFSYLSKSTPVNVPSSLVKVENNTMRTVAASAARQDNLVNDMRSTIYKQTPSRVPKFDANAIIQVNPKMLSQTATLSSNEVADVAGRVLGIPAEQLRSAVNAAQEDGIKSSETASVSPEEEARRKQKILKDKAGLSDAQARMILPLVGGLSTEAKAFMREQRSISSQVIEENKSSGLTSMTAVNTHNREKLAEIENPRNPVPVIPESVVRQVIHDAEFHPVVGNYDGLSGRREEVSAQGRVNYIVESLIAKGYPASAIKQVWMVGPIRRGEQGTIDKFNTTAAVKTKTGWLALDSIEGQAVPLDEWVNRRMQLSQNQMATLYYRDPQRAPQELSEYDRAHLGVNVARRGVSKGPQKIGDYFEAINNFVIKTASVPQN